MINQDKSIAWNDMVTMSRMQILVILQGHKSTIHTVCWDLMGDHLASVSDDLVQVWAVGSNVKGELVHELNSNGKKFHSCIFHPTQRSVLIIGSYQACSSGSPNFLLLASSVWFCRTGPSCAVCLFFSAMMKMRRKHGEKKMEITFHETFHNSNTSPPMPPFHLSTFLAPLERNGKQKRGNTF